MPGKYFRNFVKNGTRLSTGKTKPKKSLNGSALFYSCIIGMEGYE